MAAGPRIPGTGPGAVMACIYVHDELHVVRVSHPSLGPRGGATSRPTDLTLPLLETGLRGAKAAEGTGESNLRRDWEHTMEVLQWLHRLGLCPGKTGMR